MVPDATLIVVASSTPYTVPRVAVKAITSSCAAAKLATSTEANDAPAALNDVPISRAPYTVPEAAARVVASSPPYTVPEAEWKVVISSAP